MRATELVGNSIPWHEIIRFETTNGANRGPLIEWSSPNTRSDWSKEPGHHVMFRIETTTMLRRRIKGIIIPSALISITRSYSGLFLHDLVPPGAPTIIHFAAFVYTCFFCTKYHPTNQTSSSLASPAPKFPNKNKNVRPQDRHPRRPRGHRPRRRRQHHRLRPGLLTRPHAVVDPRSQHDDRAPGGAQPAGGPPRPLAGHGHQRRRPDPGAGRVLHRPQRQLRRRDGWTVVHLGEHAAGHAAGRKDGPCQCGRPGYHAL